jgi:hypothetical protein
MKREMLMGFTLFSILLMAQTVVASSVTIDPQYSEINNCAGCTNIETLNITWDGKKTIEVTLSTEITPDDTGIDVTYSKDKVTIHKGETVQVERTIHTSPLLMPDNYVVKTLASYTVKKPSSNPSYHPAKTSSEPEDDPPVEEPVDVPDEEPVEEPDEDPVIEDNGDSQEEQQEEETTNNSTEDFPWLLLGGAGILGAFLVMVIALLAKKKKNK